MTGARAWTRSLAMPVVLLALAGCAKQGDMAADAGAPAAEAAVASPEGAFLAYEHDVQVQLEAAKIAPRIQQIAQACQSAKFGDCAVLQVDQRSGEQPSGEVKVRIAPKGAEPLIAMAGEGGTLQSRTTRAEDLAQAVADTALTKARLEKEHARLLSYQDRKDLKIEDLMAITTRLSEIEAGVEQANKDAAQQRRRIDTQLVTLHFETTSGQRSRSEIGEALSESGGILGSSIAFLIRALAALLPVGVLALVVAWGPARGGVAAAARCRPTSRSRLMPAAGRHQPSSVSYSTNTSSSSASSCTASRTFCAVLSLPTSTSSSWMPGPMSSDSPAELESSSSMCGIRSSVSSTCSMPSRPSSRSLMARASSSVPVMRSRSMAMA